MNQKKTQNEGSIKLCIRWTNRLQDRKSKNIITLDFLSSSLFVHLKHNLIPPSFCVFLCTSFLFYFQSFRCFPSSHVSYGVKGLQQPSDMNDVDDSDSLSPNPNLWLYLVLIIKFIYFFLWRSRMIILELLSTA